MATVKTLPLPVVEWTTVVRSAEPLKKASRSRYRTLLKHGIASEGVTAALRGSTRLAGRRTFHSVLAALAVRAQQAGDAPGAAYLSKAATQLERRYAAELSEFLLRDTPENLPTADFYWPLMRDTDTALEGWESQTALVFATGRLAKTDGDSAHIEAITSTGEEVELLLPRLLTDEQGINNGDSVWVFRRLVGHAAVVDVLPAVAVTQTDSGAIEMLYQPSTEELDDQEYEAQAARQYAGGPGAPFSDDDLTRLVKASETLPVRRIKILG